MQQQQKACLLMSNVWFPSETETYCEIRLLMLLYYVVHKRFMKR